MNYALFNSTKMRSISNSANRSTAPYSLSIWTRYMIRGYELHTEFKPKGCNTTIKTTAVTAGAASYVSDTYSHLDQYNLTIVDGMGPEVTMGGYLTGGGHSPISNIFGLGSDQVYEVEMVTPKGEVITANECQNTDLFWAVRGVSTKFFYHHCSFHHFKGS